MWTLDVVDRVGDSRQLNHDVDDAHTLVVADEMLGWCFFGQVELQRQLADLAFEGRTLCLILDDYRCHGLLAPRLPAVMEHEGVLDGIVRLVVLLLRAKSHQAAVSALLADLDFEER